MLPPSTVSAKPGPMMADGPAAMSDRREAG